jgi:membrane-bound lytic murein transglycosylase D
MPAAVPEIESADDGTPDETSELPIYVNSAVQRFLDIYQGSQRAGITTALERGERYLPKIREIFASEGVPEDLAYVALVESRFQPKAVSPVKATGLWQFMPATGDRFGLSFDWFVDERRDPEKATRAAAQYLRFLHDTFHDWNLALAAYNAGEGRVRQAIRRYGTNDFWELARTPGLARETKEYVPRIHAAILLAKEPEKYGFDVSPEPAPQPAAISVGENVDLRAVARCAGADVETVQELNPELRYPATPPGAADFEVKIPADAKSEAEVDRCLAELPASERNAFRMHTVRKGQTLSAVAKRYGADVKEIAQINRISRKSHLARGTALFVPKKDLLAD